MEDYYTKKYEQMVTSYEEVLYSPVIAVVLCIIYKLMKR